MGDTVSDGLIDKTFEIENNLLGTLICDHAAIKSVDLDATDFLNPDNREIYRTMQRLHRDKRAWDFSIICEEVGSRDLARRVNELTWEGDPLKFYPPLVDEYVARVKEIRSTRIIQDVLSDLGTSDPIAFAKEIEFRAQRLTTTSGHTQLRTILPAMMKRLENARDAGLGLTGVTSGFWSVDRITWGFQPKRLHLVAARTSMGKSAFLANIAVNAAKEGKRVFVQALEESTQAVATRMLARQSRISNESLNRGQISDLSDWSKISAGMNLLAPLDIILDETGGLTSDDICRRIRKSHAVKPFDLVIVDHIQQIREREQSRHMEMSRAAQNFKDLSKEINAPVLAACQIGRAAENAEDSRPQLRHLKESGDLEQIADIVIMLYRPFYYDKNADRNLIQITFAKNRDGQIGTIDLGWNPEHMEFYEGPSKGGDWHERD